MIKESYDLIKRKYKEGVYSLEDVFKLVEKLWITKEDFQTITTYNYNGLKKSRGW
jgi:hypothetical protein